MKKFTEIISEARKKIDVQAGAVNFIDKADLKEYLTIADKFLSPEAKETVQWLIDNNDYVSRFGGENALAEFYNGPVPKDAALKKLYNDINKVVKADRILEIPVFQTEEQFKGIINKEVAPDEIILDLSTANGRNEVAKKYDKLVWKIARSFAGKSSLTIDELYSSGLQGLTQAMNSYGKRIDADENVKAYTFISYAAYMIRFQILADIKNVSHVVRIPVSAQQKEKAETGSNTKSNTVSGDTVVKAGENGDKTLFDFISGTSASTDSDINKMDTVETWKRIFAELEKKFDTRTMDIWYSFNELNGHDKMKNKELGKKYNMIPSLVTYYLYLVNSYILKNNKLRKLFMDLRELMQECRTISDKETGFWG